MISTSAALTPLCALLLAALLGGPAKSRPRDSGRSARYEDLLSLFSDWRSFQKPKLARRRPGLHAGRHGRAAPRARVLPAPAGGDRSERLAGRAAGRLPRRPRGDERARFRPSRAAGRGRTIPRSTSPSSPRRAISPRARVRSPRAPWSSGAYAFPLDRGGARRARRRHPDRSQAPRAGAGQPRRQRQGISGPTARRRMRQQSADLARLGRARPGRSGGLPARGPAGEGGDRQLRGVARGAGPVEDGPLRHRRRELRLVPQNVQLAPYTWRDEVTIMERELARARALLALEEQRNATLPAPAPIASAEEHDAALRRRRHGVHGASCATTRS